MVDVTSLVLLAASFFFVALSVALLVKYREVSKRINASTDLGRDLWSSLEQRLKKQDARIIDMMGRVDVIQSRAMAAAAAVASPTALAESPAQSVAPQAGAGPRAGHVPSSSMQQSESQESQASQPHAGPPSAPIDLDETQSAALKLLDEAPKNTRQLTDALGKSREHTARIMKELFESGLVKRNDSSKPFVYELTEEGRKRLLGP